MADSVEEISSSAVSAEAQGSDLQLDMADIQSLMADPGMMARFADQLAGMIGQSSGLIDDLSPKQQRRLKALQKLQRQHVELEIEYHNEVSALERKYAELYKPLYDKRRQIVNNEYEPTDEEAAWPPKEEDDEADAAEGPDKNAAEGEDKNESSTDPDEGAVQAAAGVEGGEDGEDDDEAEGLGGLPAFWFACLTSNELVAGMIQEHDEDVLAELIDIRSEYLEGNTGFTLHFDFKPNEYFENETLSKTYHLVPEADGDDALFYEGPIFKEAVGTEIKWKPGKDVTVKIVKKKQRKKTGANKGETRTITKRTQQDSFFNFFNPPAVSEDMPDEQLEEMAQVLHADYFIGDILLSKIIPGAVLWFTGEANEFEDGDDEDEEEEEDLDDDDDDDDDLFASSKPAAPASKGAALFDDDEEEEGAPADEGSVSVDVAKLRAFLTANGALEDGKAYTAKELVAVIEA
eukprot:m.100314 g.100314  ORF g.100314 m.100314 type:complete len:462 (-) comp15121_c2_seq1:696-2081(-)